MKELQYLCNKEKLQSELREVFKQKNISIEKKKFRDTKNTYYRIKFVLFILLKVLKLHHYYIMGLLGYTTFLIEEDYAGELLGGKRKSLLDIGAGSGTITKKFEPFVEEISCREPSSSFQKILKKRGYKIIDENNAALYEVITLFNVIDICKYPEKLMNFALEHLETNGIMIITLPLPIYTQSWDNKNIRKTNQLTQPKELSFEESASDFYTNFLKTHHLRVIHFSRIPYLVALPEEKSACNYDSGLFVCKKN